MPGAGTFSATSKGLLALRRPLRARRCSWPARSPSNSPPLDLVDCLAHLGVAVADDRTGRGALAHRHLTAQFDVAACWCTSLLGGFEARPGWSK